MKRFLFLALLAIAGRFAQPVHAQLVEVIDVTVAEALHETKIENAISFAQMLKDNADMIWHTIDMVQNTANIVQLSTQNLRSFEDIKSYDDFMGWYNRQLYYDRTVQESFNNITVTVGKKDYKLLDLEGWGNGLYDTYATNPFDKDITEEQRREMWLRLGLTPANYAYVLPFRQQASDLRRRFLVASDIENEKYMKAMEQNKIKKDKLAGDKLLQLDDKMGEKEALMMIADTSIANNEVLHDLVMLMTDMMGLQAVQHYLEQTPPDAPALSEWPKDGFRKLK